MRSRELTGDFRLTRRWRMALQFKPADLWVGVYYAGHGGWWDVWVCLVPCFPIHFWSTES
jgi:hypothetical protein